VTPEVFVAARGASEWAQAAIYATVVPATFELIRQQKKVNIETMLPERGMWGPGRGGSGAGQGPRGEDKSAGGGTEAATRFAANGL
jgi:hypothetical protein